MDLDKLVMYLPIWYWEYLNSHTKCMPNPCLLKGPLGCWGPPHLRPPHIMHHHHPQWATQVARTIVGSMATLFMGHIHYLESFEIGSFFILFFSFFFPWKRKRKKCKLFPNCYYIWVNGNWPIFHKYVPNQSKLTGDLVDVWKGFGRHEMKGRPQNLTK